jgi:endonuclease III
MLPLPGQTSHDVSDGKASEEMAAERAPSGESQRRSTRAWAKRSAAVARAEGSLSLPDAESLAQSLLYSEELGLDLTLGRERDLFLWFLASLLFGQRISETIARNTYHAFVRHGLSSPRKILAAGWDYLVDPVMREGGYVRYDESKSRKILRDCQTLLDRYGGSLQRLHESARDRADLEARLLDFYGVGPVTVNIFLRELRPYWAKADPEPLPVVAKLARQIGIDLNAYDRKSLAFARLEAGLIRLRHRLRQASAKKGSAKESRAEVS